MRNLKILPPLFLLILTILVYRAWFILKPLSGGDYITFWPENLKNYFNFPFSSWDHQIDLGWYIGALLHYAPYSLLMGLAGRVLNYNPVIIERLFWLFPFLGLSLFSSVCLFKTLFSKNNLWFFSSLIFLFNTYVLMMTGGGQVGGIGLAYAIAPLVLACFINSIKEISLKWSILSGIALALQIMFDPRITYITIGAIFLYALFWCGRGFKKYLFIFGIPLLISLGLHFFWLLPSFLAKKPSLPVGYGEPGWVEFLSFARFSDSVSLLHPNWSENIFGKTYFFRPEFLILPILAFSSLLFINYSITNYELRIKKNVLVFALLGIVGAFLAKGANPPFGEIYLWLFKNIPGMNMFRDPTKFYILVALSYSVLIPFSVEQIYLYLRKKFNN